MIEIRFEEREKIGLQYILESLHGCSPFGQERIRRLRYYTPDQRQELELELYNVERAAAHAEELKDLYDQICVVLCQMKDIRGSLRRCRELEQRGTPQPYEQVLRDIADRDWADSHRDIAPLCKAEDAVELDTGALTFDESLRLLLDTIRRRAGL